MRFLIVIFLLLFPSFAFSADFGFFTDVNNFFDDVWSFITVTIPEAIESFFVFIATYSLYLKFYFIKESLIFSHTVATSFLDMVDLNQVINSSVSALPGDLKQVVVDIGFFEALTLVVEAGITRFVYQWGK
jgi:hypothetical protein